MIGAKNIIPGFDVSTSAINLFINLILIDWSRFNPPVTLIFAKASRFSTNTTAFPSRLTFFRIFLILLESSKSLNEILMKGEFTSPAKAFTIEELFNSVVESTKRYPCGFIEEIFSNFFDNFKYSAIFTKDSMVSFEMESWTLFKVSSGMGKVFPLNLERMRKPTSRNKVVALMSAIPTSLFLIIFRLLSIFMKSFSLSELIRWVFPFLIKLSETKLKRISALTCISLLRGLDSLWPPPGEANSEPVSMAGEVELVEDGMKPGL